MWREKKKKVFHRIHILYEMYKVLKNSTGRYLQLKKQLEDYSHHEKIPTSQTMTDQQSNTETGTEDSDSVKSVKTT